MKPHAWALLAAVGGSCATADLQAEELAACLTTTPGGALLAEPFPSADRWYGSEALAVILPPGGIWNGLGPERHYRNKLFWWSAGFRPGLEHNLTVTGRRLDADAPPATVSRSTNAHSPSLGGWTLLVGVEFPSAGCWQILGEYLGQKLAFTVEVPASRAQAVPTRD
jgi:hypothetical protein